MHVTINITGIIKVALQRNQNVNNNIYGLFIDIDHQPAMPNSRNTNFVARAHYTANEDIF